MYNTWHWHLEMTVIDNIDEYIMGNKGTTTFETCKRRPDLLLWIHSLQQMWEWVRDAAARFNTLLTAAAPGLTRRPHKHPVDTWNKILGLALSCHTYLHTFVFLASQAVFTSSNTMGTVVTQTYFLVTQTYFLWYHENSHRDSGETYLHKHTSYDTTGKVTETVMRHMIPREQCWDSGGDTEYF